MWTLCPSPVVCSEPQVPVAGSRGTAGGESDSGCASDAFPRWLMRVSGHNFRPMSFWWRITMVVDSGVTSCAVTYSQIWTKDAVCALSAPVRERDTGTRENPHRGRTEAHNSGPGWCFSGSRTCHHPVTSREARHQPRRDVHAEGSTSGPQACGSRTPGPDASCLSLEHIRLPPAGLCV